MTIFDVVVVDAVLNVIQLVEKSLVEHLRVSLVKVDNGVLVLALMAKEG